MVNGTLIDAARRTLSKVTAVKRDHAAKTPQAERELSVMGGWGAAMRE